MPMQNLTRNEAPSIAGNAHCFIPLLCIHRIHLLPIASLREPCSSVTGLRVVMRLRLLWKPRAERVVECGEAALDDEGDTLGSGLPLSHAWLNVESKRCLLGVGEWISGETDWPRLKRSAPTKSNTSV
jgi:hypothetical protein